MKEGSIRVIKITTNSLEERDKVLALAHKLKSSDWKNIYLKKDLHPVYSRENSRIRRKRNDLIKQYADQEEEHDIRIMKGELQVDGITIDRNLFFQ